MSEIRGAILNALLEMEEQEGVITSAGYVARANDPTHPFHSTLTWSDEECGRAYRLIEAARVIRSYKTEIETGNGDKLVRVRRFVSMPEHGGYVSTEKLMASTESDVFMTQLRRDIKRLELKYRSFTAFRETLLAILQEPAA
jgi:hypothetical protein